ncbi:MAG: histidinol phosphatase [Actinomycetales bacterium]|nr:histidinol phosphatase [Actinomycetales bacterium]
MSDAAAPEDDGARDLAADLHIALACLDRAAEISVPGWLGDRTPTRKADGSPVTETDIACEEAIRALLAAERPADGVYGEERPTTAGDSGWQWVIDPIDGTSNFTRGMPVWATLIGLVSPQGRPVVGAVGAPALGMRWWAHDGGPAYHTAPLQQAPKPIAVSHVDSLERAYASVAIGENGRAADPRTLADGSAIDMLAIEAAIARRVWRLRGLGDFLAHLLVAQGALDIAIDTPGLAPYDVAALVPIVTAAGGRMTTFDGAADYAHGTAMSTNGHLHAAAQGALAAACRTSE